MRKNSQHFIKAISQPFAIFFVCFLVSCQAKKASENEWTQLFNGNDLDGWEVKIKGYELGENFGNTFRVEDGLLKVRYNAYDSFNNRFGHLFYNKAYSHYRLRVEYRFTGTQCPGGAEWASRNSGIMLHGQPAESMGKDQDFPVSLEVQLLGDDGSQTKPTANLCTPGMHVIMKDQLLTEHCTNSSSPAFTDNEWVTVEVEVHGGEVIRHFVNGEQVMTYSNPQLDAHDPNYNKMLEVYGNKFITKGSISLQSESHPIDFRKVELKVIESKAN